jgi:ribosomal protein L37E
LIVCKRCGFKNQDDDADFCASCGRFLEWTGEKVEQQTAAPEAAAPEEDEAGGRKGIIERAGDWVQQRTAGSGERTPGEGGVLVADDDRAGAQVPGAAAPAASTVAGPTMPGAAVPAAAGDGPAVFGPALPPPGPESDLPAGDGDGRQAVASTAAPAVEDDRPAPVVPTAARDPLLAALIASPVAVVPALEPEPQKVEAFKPDLGGTEGPAHREAAPERQPGMPIEKEVFRPAQYSKELTGPTRVVREGDIVCPRCGQGNYTWRNYCRRCGLVLDHVKANAERRGPWRWLWGGLSYPVHRHRRKLVHAGERPGRKLRSSPRARSTGRHFQMPQFNKKKFAKLLPLLFIIVLIFGFVGPWKKSFRNTYERWKNDVLHTVDINYTQVFPVSVTASGSAPGHGPESANDNTLSTFWLSAAPPQPVPKVVCTNVTVTVPKTSTKKATTKTEKKCTTVKPPPPKKGAKKKPLPSGVGQYLLLDFTQPETIGGFAIFTGAQDNPTDFNNYEKPKEIELIFSSGPAQYESISQVKTLQTFKFVHTSTTSLKIVVTEVYPGAGTTVQKEQVAISDVFAYVLS